MVETGLILRPSGSDRWMKCTASVHFPHHRDEEELDAAREGTCAAWVAEMVIQKLVPNAGAMVGQAHENGWVVDQDMADHIDKYVGVVSRRTVGEAEVFMKHPSYPIQGTADHVGWADDMRTVFITDLKYGYKLVGPDTWQLVCYLLLLLSNLSRDQYPEYIQLAIYQPRAISSEGVYRRKVYHIDEALKLVAEVYAQMDAILTTEGVAIPGSHCYKCTKAIGCMALTQSVYAMVDVISHRKYVTPTSEQLAQELIMIQMATDLFEARKDAVETEATTLIETGGFVPGWHIQTRHGKKKFVVDDLTIQILTGIDPAAKKTCTPAELLRRGADPDVVSQITTIPRIGSKLMRIDDDYISDIMKG